MLITKDMVEYSEIREFVLEEYNKIAGKIKEKFISLDKKYTITTINFNSQEVICTTINEAD